MRKLARNIAKARIAKKGLSKTYKKRNAYLSPAAMRRLKNDSAYFRSFFSEHWRQIAGLEKEEK